MRNQPMLFDVAAPPRPRKKPRVLMHVCDAGESIDFGDVLVRFKCRRCEHETDYLAVRTVTEAKRGRPCPRCNISEEMSP